MNLSLVSRCLFDVLVVIMVVFLEFVLHCVVRQAYVVVSAVL